MNSKSNDEFNQELNEFLNNLFSTQMSISYNKQQDLNQKSISGIPKEIMEYFNMEACRSNHLIFYYFIDE